MLLRNFVLLTLMLGLGACSQQDLLQKFASPQEQSWARGYFDLLRHQQFDVIQKDLDPALLGPSFWPTLVVMQRAIPPGEPTSVQLVGAQRIKKPDGTLVNLTFEYGFSGRWLVTNVAIKEQAGGRRLVGLRIYPEAQSLEQRNRFTLTGRTPLHYLVLALTIAVPLFILATLVVCLRTELAGRKWPWVIFVLLGFGRFAVNWTTGQWSLGVLSVQLFGASATAAAYGPWILAVSLPVGAVVFLMKRQKLRAPGRG